MKIVSPLPGKLLRSSNAANFKTAELNTIMNPKRLKANTAVYNRKSGLYAAPKAIEA